MKKLWILKFLLVFFLFEGCVSTETYNKLLDEYNTYKKEAIKLNEGKINTTAIKDDFISLPKRTELYRKHPELLIGDIIIIYDASETEKDIQTIGNFRKLGDKGGEILIDDISSETPLYSSRITGKYGAELSFFGNNLNANADYLYDVSLQPITNVEILKNWSYFDYTNPIIQASIKAKYLAIYLITAAEYRLLSYKEYWKIEGNGSADVTGIKFNGNAYYGDERLKMFPIMCFDGIELSELFGHEVTENGKTYYEKDTDRTIAQKLEELRSTSPERLIIPKDRINEINELILNNSRKLNK